MQQNNSEKIETYHKNKQRNLTRNKICSLLQKSQNPINYLDIFKQVNQYSWITQKTVANMLGKNCDGNFERRDSGWTFNPSRFSENKCSNFKRIEIDFGANFKRCPHCGSEDKIYMIVKRKIAKCGRCQINTTAITGTIFGNCKIPVTKLVLAIGLFNESEGKISSHKLSRMVKITQQSAYNLKKRMSQPTKTPCSIKDDLNNSESVNDWNKSEVDLYSRNPDFDSFDIQNKTSERELYETFSFSP